MGWLEGYLSNSNTEQQPHDQRAHCGQCQYPLALWVLPDRVFVWCSVCFLSAEDWRVIES